MGILDGSINKVQGDATQDPAQVDAIITKAIASLGTILAPVIADISAIRQDVDKLIAEGLALEAKLRLGG